MFEDYRFDTEAKTESISVRGLSHHQKGSYTVTDGPIFQTGCDLFSINYSDLGTELLKILKADGDTEIDQMIDVLEGYHPLLADDDFIEKMILHYNLDGRLGNDFASLTFLQQYATMLADGEITFSSDTFCSLFNSFTGWTLNQNWQVIEESGFEKVRNEPVPSAKELRAAILRILNREEPELPDTFPAVSHVVEFCTLTLYTILSKGYVLKRCDLCGKLFVPAGRKLAIYCERTCPKDSKRTCREYGNEKRWYERQQDDRVMKLYRTVYAAREARARRNQEVEKYRQSFEKFKVEAKKWREDYRAFRVSEEEIIHWLDIQRLTR